MRLQSEFETFFFFGRPKRGVRPKKQIQFCSKVQYNIENAKEEIEHNFAFHFFCQNQYYYFIIFVFLSIKNAHKNIPVCSLLLSASSSFLVAAALPAHPLPLLS